MNAAHAQRFSRAAWVLVFAGTLGVPAPAAPLWAQRAPVTLELPAKTALAKIGPGIRTIGIVTASHTAELIKNGFPALLHYKVERWAAGTFINRVKASSEWDIIVEFDALAERYRIIRTMDEHAVVVGEYKTLQEADARLDEEYDVPIKPPRVGEKTYYTVSLTVEAMSLHDLDEVRRWLNGELKPAVQGRRNPGTAVSSGLRAIFVRMLGGERLTYQASTGVFRP